MCADQQLEPWRHQVQRIAFYPADARRHDIRAFHPSYVTKGMLWVIFHGGLSKKGVPWPKAARRYCVVLAALSWCNGLIGYGQGKKVAAQGKFFKGSILDYRSPFWNGEGARPEKIGRRSSTALHVWSGAADASSSDVP